MKIDHFPGDVRGRLVPRPAGRMVYECLSCGKHHGIENLLYTCPDCGGVLLLIDLSFDRLKDTPPEAWHRIFDHRKMLNLPAIKGIYRYQELLGPVVPVESMVWLGEGHTPMVEAAPDLQKKAGVRFLYKNDGQNPSASFKDRGMASALSYIKHLLDQGYAEEILAVCASTGDTSASAALYASYLYPRVKSAVLLPKGKVTPAQLSQPLGSGAAVFEIPGVFDDCMKVVEALAENYNVALLNSKNAWRILGQESYSFEIAQDLDWDCKNLAVFVPIGNAGNITAVMSGFLKLFRLGIIRDLPKIVGVQSHHADPVYRYYLEPDEQKRVFAPVTVQPSTAQAAMIGNPVSMPRVIRVVRDYNELSGNKNVFVVQVTEQDIMDSMLTANRRGHIACTQGGECLAGLLAAVGQGIVTPEETAILDATAHALKFSGFQEMYFENRFPPEFGVIPKPELINRPQEAGPGDGAAVPAAGAPLSGEEFEVFVEKTSQEIARILDLAPLR
ncbi:MAG: threonine synthase [Deltaproteobacteria bacterium]|nr:threonine synthase [Deltaproteobacteria bacterium]